MVASAVMVRGPSQACGLTVSLPAARNHDNEKPLPGGTSRYKEVQASLREPSGASSRRIRARARVSQGGPSDSVKSSCGKLSPIDSVKGTAKEKKVHEFLVRLHRVNMSPSQIANQVVGNETAA